MPVQTPMTKAQTLAFLSTRLSKGRILSLLVVKYKEFQENRKEVVRTVQTFFLEQTSYVIVRSSSVQEDSEQTSNAGCFESVVNVAIWEPNALEAAIQQVFNSYQNKTLPKRC